MKKGTQMTPRDAADWIVQYGEHVNMLLAHIGNLSTFIDDPGLSDAEYRRVSMLVIGRLERAAKMVEAHTYGGPK